MKQSTLFLSILIAFSGFTNAQILEPYKTSQILNNEDYRDILKNTISTFIGNSNIDLDEFESTYSSIDKDFSSKNISDQINRLALSFLNTGIDSVQLANYIEKEIEQKLNKSGLIQESELSIQTDGTSKLDIQAFKFTIAPNTFSRIKGFSGIPLYVNISPEFNLIDKDESSEELSKKLLNTTGGSFNISVKDYFRLVPFKPNPEDDLNIRWFYLATAKHLNEIDSTGTTTKTDFNYNIGVGANLEAQIVGQDGGVLTLEYQIKRFGTFDSNYENLFGSEANKKFFAHTFYTQLKLVNLIDIRLEYYRSFDSSISKLDDGFVIFTFGLSKNL